MWTAFGLFFGAQNYIRDVYIGKGASLPGYIVSWLLCGYSWAVLTVPALRCTRRFSLERLGWSRFFLVHLPASAAFALVQLGIYVLIAGVLFGMANRGVWEFYKFIVVNEFQSSFLVYFAIVAAVTVRERWFRQPELWRPVEPSPLPEKRAETAEPEKNGASLAFPPRIPVKENGRIRIVEVVDIEWVESYGNYVFLHTAERRHILRETMAAMEKMLDPQDFVRIRRSAIVRVDRIKELRSTSNGEFEVVLKDRRGLSSSRRYRKNLETFVKR